MRGIGDAERLVEELEVGLFGYARDQVMAAKVSIQLAESRLAALAKLRRDVA
jgi:hypothetical protein